MLLTRWRHSTAPTSCVGVVRLQSAVGGLAGRGITTPRRPHQTPETVRRPAAVVRRHTTADRWHVVRQRGTCTVPDGVQHRRRPRRGIYISRRLSLYTAMCEDKSRRQMLPSPSADEAIMHRTGLPVIQALWVWPDDPSKILVGWVTMQLSHQ